MGFSVSGSAALIFAAMFIAFGMWHSAATNSFERVSDAQQIQADDTLTERNTAITIDRAFYDGNGNLEFEATNGGSTALSLNATTLLIDNEHYAGWRGGALTADTDLWLPGEQITFTIGSFSSQPDRVKLVTENGVAEATEVVS